MATTKYTDLMDFVTRRLATLSENIKKFSLKSPTLFEKYAETIDSLLSDVYDALQTLSEISASKAVLRIKGNFPIFIKRVNEDDLSLKDYREMCHEMIEKIASIKLERDSYSELNSAVGKLQTLDMVTLKDKEKSVIFYKKAPIVFVTKFIDKYVQKKLSEIGITQASPGYFFCKECGFIVANLDELKTDLSAESQINVIVQSMNKKYNKDFIPYYDFSKNVRNYLVVLVIGSSYSQAITKFREGCTKYSIYIN